jgi:hypothetical protein
MALCKTCSSVTTSWPVTAWVIIHIKKPIYLLFLILIMALISYMLRNAAYKEPGFLPPVTTETNVRHYNRGFVERISK